MEKTQLHNEVVRRFNLLTDLDSAYGSTELKTELFRELGFLAGQQGIYVDKINTSHLSDNEYGITVSVLHTGKVYDDDLYDDSIIYHYPETNRAGTRDLGEIEATKNCQRYSIPLFVISASKENKNLRDIHLGSVIDYDDNAKLF